MNTCKNCKYFNTCGDAERTAPCNGYTAGQEANTMKTFKQITAEIKKNADKIEAMTNEIMKLDAKQEKREAIQSHNIEEYKRLQAEAEANADKIAQLSDKIYLLNVTNRVLKENALASHTAHTLEAIAQACEPYNGKPYGEKTRDKIYKEVRETAQAGFYFTGYLTTDRIEAHALNDEQRTIYGYDCTIYAQNERPFITKDNKIDLEAIKSARNPYRYSENPTKQAKAIIKAYNIYRDTTAKAEQAQSALNALLPHTIDNFYKVRAPRHTIIDN